MEQKLRKNYIIMIYNNLENEILGTCFKSKNDKFQVEPLKKEQLSFCYLLPNVVQNLEAGNMIRIYQKGCEIKVEIGKRYQEGQEEYFEIKEEASSICVEDAFIQLDQKLIHHQEEQKSDSKLNRYYGMRLYK